MNTIVLHPPKPSNVSTPGASSTTLKNIDSSSLNPRNGNSSLNPRNGNSSLNPRNGNSSMNPRNYSKEVEMILKASKNHVVKWGNGFRDDLPGINDNNYG